jgi:hypothetical protein
MWVGTREFDPVSVGYKNEHLEWAFEFDVSLEGNHNTGHQFTNAGGMGVIGPALTHDERMALIEYIKTLGNPKYNPADYAAYVEPLSRLGKLRCSADLQGPASNPELKWPM